MSYLYKMYRSIVIRILYINDSTNIVNYEIPEEGKLYNTFYRNRDIGFINPISKLSMNNEIYLSACAHSPINLSFSYRN